MHDTVIIKAGIRRILETRIVFHIDFDYFYAQCEETRSPELRTKPVCVCVFSDRGGDSGAIATANYTARKYGVKSGIPISFAKKRLKDREDAVFLPVDFDFYSEMSENAMSIIEKRADTFEYVSRDEAYLDVSERTDGNFEKAGHLAQQLKNTIRDKTKLSCSIGVSPNKLVSKIASDFEKPDGLTIVSQDKVAGFLEPLKIRSIPGIGIKTEARLTGMGFETVLDLKRMDVFSLNKEFGRKTGTYIYNAVRGIDQRPVKERKASVQYSKITTLKIDSKDYQFLHENITELCSQVHDVLKKNNQAFKSVGIQFVQSDMSNKSRTRMLKSSTSDIKELQRTADQLLKEALESQTRTIRRLGVKVSELSDVQGQSDITAYF